MAVVQVTRQEIKYQISMLEFKKLESKLSVFMIRDKYVDEYGKYKVRSLYFDTPFEKDRFDVEEGAVKRHKIRLRVYSPEDKYAKLELKAKEGNFQRKSSIVITREEAKQMCAGNYGFLLSYDTDLARYIYNLLVSGMYVPRVLIEYDRIAYYVPVKSTRVTFDYNAVASRTNLDVFAKDVCWTPLRPASIGVLEVKYNGYLLSYLQELIEEIDKLPTANGKYLFACRI